MLIPFKTMMNSSYCIQILQDYLIPNARRQFGGRWQLQRDNNPKHKSRLAQQFLSSEVVEVIDWSSNSPYANSANNYQTSCGETKNNKSGRIALYCIYIYI